jgi:hypothetical protein
MASETLTRGALPRVQWGPVIAGALCALAAQIVLGLFGVAFGFASAPANDRGIGILAGIWALATPIVASFIGAWVAVRIAGHRDEAGAFLHGALVWCMGLLAGALFITGSIASGAMTAGTAASGNVGPRTLTQRDTTAGRTRVQAAGEDAAKGAAAGTGAAAVASLLGLGGALLGAAVGRKAIAGERMMRRAGRSRESELRSEVPVEESGVAYTDRTGAVTTRPPNVRRAPPDEPGLHH